jgi:hypothetical protein
MRGDLEEVMIMKVFQIVFSTPTNIFRFFPCCLPIFPTLEFDFRFILNQKNTDMWGPPVSG